MPKIPPQDLDLSQVIEDESRLFHLRAGRYHVPLRIRRMGADYLYVDAHPALRRKNLEGYIIANKGKGLLNFQCKIEGAEIPATESRFDIVELKVVPGTFEYLNKREFRRLDFPLAQQCRVTFLPENRAITARILDLSASGIGFSTEEKIPDGQIALFSSELPILSPLPFEFGIQVIYRLTDPDNPSLSRYGARFLVDKDEKPLPSLKPALQKKIVQYVNRELIRRKKMTEDEA